MDSFCATRIYISRGFAFATVNAAREFEEQRARFFDDYEQRDDYLEVRKGQSFGDLVVVRKNQISLNSLTRYIGSSLPVDRIKKIDSRR